ncbi:MAG: hypothetical protein ACK4Z5_02805 [Brevundimonas sp.]
MHDPTSLDQLRNEAVLAWLQPAADDHRLRAFLAGLEAGERDEVAQSARTVRQVLKAFLSAGFPGDQDEALFVTAVRAHLVARFPWLSEDALQALIDHTDWMY